MLTRCVLALTATTALLLTGCADAVDGSGTAAAQAPFPRTSAQLADLMTRGTRTIHSAHVVLDFNVGSTAVTATGAEQLRNGRATAMTITERVPGFGAVQLRAIGHSTLYVKDPRRAATSTPWVHVTAATSDPVLRQFYSSLQSTASIGSIASMATLLAAAQQLRFLGAATINGVAVGHYRFVVQTAKLPASFPGRDVIIAAGVDQIPVELYVDHEGRACKGADTVSVGTTKATIGFELTGFNTPVHIIAPPADQTAN